MYLNICVHIYNCKHSDHSLKFFPTDFVIITVSQRVEEMFIIYYRYKIKWWAWVKLSPEETLKGNWTELSAAAPRQGSWCSPHSVIPSYIPSVITQMLESDLRSDCFVWVAEDQTSECGSSLSLEGVDTLNLNHPSVNSLEKEMKTEDMDLKSCIIMLILYKWR